MISTIVTDIIPPPPSGIRWRQVVRFWTPRNMLSAPVFGVSLVLAGIGNLSVADDVIRVPERLAIVTAIHLALFGTLWIVTRVFRGLFSGPRGWLALALTLALAGVGRAALLAFLFDVLEVGAPLYLSRIFYSFSNPTALILLLTALWGAFGDHARTSHSLREVRAHQRANEQSIAGEEDSLSPDRLAALRRSLASVLYPLADPHVDPPTAAESLRRAIDTVVRPVTRTLAETTITPVMPRPVLPRESRRRINIVQAALDALDLKAAWPAVVSVFAFFAGIPAGLQLLGPARGVINSVVGLIAGLAILLVARWIALRWPGRWSRFAHLPVSALAAVAAYGLPLVVLGFPPPPNPLGASVVFYLVCGYLLALAHSAFTRAAAARAQLAADNDRLEHQLARRRAVVHVRRSSVARALHGTVQARLTAAFLRLNLAINSGARTDVEGALESARSDAFATLDDVREGLVDRRGVSEIVTELNEIWDEIASVWLIAPADRITRGHTDPLCSALIAELLPELVFNAIKHSGAASVAIDLDWPDDQSLRLVLYFDHHETPSPSTRSGLGTRTLDEVCLRWSRQVDVHRGRTEIVLPWSDAPAEALPAE